MSFRDYSNHSGNSVKMPKVEIPPDKADAPVDSEFGVCTAPPIGTPEGTVEEGGATLEPLANGLKAW